MSKTRDRSNEVLTVSYFYITVSIPLHGFVVTFILNPQASKKLIFIAKIRITFSKKY